MVYFLHKHIRGGRSKGPLVIVLTVNIEQGIGMMLMQVVLRFSKHATGATCRVEEPAYCTASGKELVILNEEDIYHEPDDLAWSEAH